MSYNQSTSYWIAREKAFSVEVKCWSWSDEEWAWNVYAHIFEDHPDFNDAQLLMEASPLSGGCTYDKEKVIQPVGGPQYDWQRVSRVITIGSDYKHIWDADYSGCGPDGEIPRKIENDALELAEWLRHRNELQEPRMNKRSLIADTDQRSREAFEKWRSLWSPDAQPPDIEDAWKAACQYKDEQMEAAFSEIEKAAKAKDEQYKRLERKLAKTEACYLAKSYRAKELEVQLAKWKETCDANLDAAVESGREVQILSDRIKEIEAQRVPEGWQPITAQEAMEAFDVLRENAHEFASSGLMEEWAENDWADRTLKRYIEQSGDLSRADQPRTERSSTAQEALDFVAQAEDAISGLYQGKFRDCINIISTELSSAAQDREDAAKYRELIYSVASKFPGESCHETALRYIRNAENQCNGPKDARQQGRG